MSIFQQLGQAPQQVGNPMQMLSQLRSNPVGMLKQAGYNIPDGMTNPQQIVNHLLNSGQVNNGRLNMAQQMAQQFGRK